MSKSTKKPKLDVKYGDVLTVTKGFFRGLSGKAIDFAPQEEDIYSKFGIQSYDYSERQYKESSYQIKLDDSGAKHWFFEKDLKIKTVSVKKKKSSMQGVKIGILG